MCLKNRQNRWNSAVLYSGGHRPAPCEAATKKGIIMAKNLYLDLSRLPQMLAASVGPKNEYVDGKATGAQATDPAGTPLWRVSVFVMDESAQRAPETVSVTVPAPVAPALPALSPVVFHGLRVLLWSGGASLRADGVEVVGSDGAPEPTSAFLSAIAGGE